MYLKAKMDRIIISKNLLILFYLLTRQARQIRNRTILPFVCYLIPIITSNMRGNVLLTAWNLTIISK